MMRQIFTFIFSFFLLCLAVAAQAQTPAGNYANPVFCSSTHTQVKPECCTPGMFRVRTSWIRRFAGNEPHMVVKTVQQAAK